jgi:hypothetical protein
MERTRVLTQPFDLTKLHSEFVAQSPSAFRGLIESAGVVRILGAEDLTDAQVDALIAAHVPPTADERAQANGIREFDTNRALQAAVLYVREQLNALRALHALPALTIAQVKQGVVDKYKALG